MMIGYEIYDRFTMEHFTLRQRMTLTTKIYCSRLYINLEGEIFKIIIKNSQSSISSNYVIQIRYILFTDHTHLIL
jgi:hypothetical protein